MEDTSKTQIKLLEMKTTVYEMKNNWNVMNKTSDFAEQKMSKL